ncbi:hypothetical protein [Chitinophaga rhizophila]|uniref:Lipoprotein n=1 Tax=Chitinophaga rhizophila TaxID=2866212 RepID=A0ABS7GL36_9BACT|nr:hypothetical protein [Chitinophaga rhizophila]MBW8687449.1 hypothetical protein [Chitinophaga rhizophila]
MLNSTWNKFKQPASRTISSCMLAGIFIFGACRTNRGYDPAPRMGAEYRFEEGLRKEKNPQYLFDKKSRKEMAGMGYPTGEPNAASPQAGGTTTPAKSQSGATVNTTPRDSLRVDTVFKVKPQ